MPFGPFAYRVDPENANTLPHLHAEIPRADGERGSGLHRIAVPGVRFVRRGGHTGQADSGLDGTHIVTRREELDLATEMRGDADIRFQRLLLPLGHDYDHARPDERRAPAAPAPPWGPPTITPAGMNAVPPPLSCSNCS